MQLTIILLIVAVAVSQAKLLPASAAMKPLSSTTLKKVVSVRGGALVSKETFVKVCVSPGYTCWPVFIQH